MTVLALSLSFLSVALIGCALLGARVRLNFILDAQNAALCVDVFTPGIHSVKARLFTVSDGVCLKLGKGDPIRLPAPKDGGETSHAPKERRSLRPVLAALASWNLCCDRLTVRLAIPLGDHPETEIKLLAANFAMSAAIAILSPCECDCDLRVADVGHATFYGSITLSFANALDCALRCVSAAKAAKRNTGANDG